MKVIEKAQAIYDLTMNERCEAKVQDLFSNGLHKLMIDLIEELEELENRSCDNCKYFINYHCSNDWWMSNDLPDDTFKVYDDFCCNKWKSKNENL